MKNSPVVDAREVFLGSTSVYLSAHRRREISRLEKRYSRPTLSDSYIM